MDTLYLAVYLLILLITVIFPLYLFGRVWFALSPFVINLYFSEQKSWYNDWNSNRSIIVLSLSVISLLLSLFWGLSILEKIKEAQLDVTSILFYVFLQFLCFVLLEGKMDHPFKPYAAYKKFSKEKYDERFIFKNQIGTNETILLHSEELKKVIQNSKESLSEEIFQQKNFFQEIHQLATENNQILKTSDFDFEIRNTEHLILADVMAEYYISKTSEQVLSDFLLRKKKSGKIIFIKKPTNGVGVRPLFDFFSKFTDLIERCNKRESTEADNETKQVEAIKIINEIVLATDKDGKQVKNPIDSKNFSKYLN